ncbi:hypothetical protein F5Y16DRAFT_327910 [Xylariaceae sp. FL0255]|nr:hypothetical protein F5Y16DRAFT_327910 [Xylariaceae sp. FL0255]
MLELPSLPYSQLTIAMCLDLGEYGAVIGDGWDLKFVSTGMTAKPVKKFINKSLIYPPAAVAFDAFAVADPRWDGSDNAVNHPTLKAFMAELCMSC